MSLRCFPLVLSALAALHQRASLVAPLPRLYPDAYEIALARSAAPPELSKGADVYVLRRGGHVKVISGTNGAACLVSRDHPESLYPICYDPEAARTILQVALEQSRLREGGIGEDSVSALIHASFRDGSLKAPLGPAIAYMMSRHQLIYASASGPRVGTWFPHVMIYMPNLTPLQLAMPGLANGDLTISHKGSPTAHYVVMTREWAVAEPLPSLGPTLTVEKGWLCKGDTFALRWNGKASDRLRIRDNRRQQTISLGSSHQFTALTETELRVIDQRDSTIAVDTVSLHPERMEHNFQRPSATCTGRLAVASMGIPPSVGSDRIQPQVVTNRGANPVTVTHRGVSARLMPGESTDRFNALPFTGDWGVVLDTGAFNPFCPAAAASPPPPIDLLIVTACAPQS